MSGAVALVVRREPATPFRSFLQNALVAAAGRAVPRQGASRRTWAPASARCRRGRQIYTLRAMDYLLWIVGPCPLRAALMGASAAGWIGHDAMISLASALRVAEEIAGGGGLTARRPIGAHPRARGWTTTRRRRAAPRTWRWLCRFCGQMREKTRHGRCEPEWPYAPAA